MKIIATFYFLCLSIISFGQKHTGGTPLDVSQIRKSKKGITVFQTILASNGRIVAVGQIKTDPNGGKGGYVAMMNPFGTDINEYVFGGKNDDVFKSVMELNNGTFLIVGSTKSKNNGRETPWLLQIDEKGEFLNEKIYDRGTEEAFQAIVPSDDGGAFLISSYDNSREKEIRVIKILDSIVQFDTPYYIGGFVKNIKSAVSTHDGGLVLLGDTKKSKQAKADNIWVLKLDIKGGITPFNYRYGADDYVEEAGQIIRTADNGFAIVGSTTNSNGKNVNAWLLKLDEAGNQQWENTNLGGNDKDYGYTVTQTYDDQYYIVGTSKSQSPDALKTDIFTVKVTSGSVEKWKSFYGTLDDDAAQFITPLYDGSFFVSASTDNQTWYYRFRATDDNLDNTGVPNQAFRQWDWSVNSDTRFLEAGKRQSISVKIKNTTPSLLKNVQIKCSSPSDLLKPQTITYLGAFRGNETKNVNIPIKTDIGLEDKPYTLHFSIVVGNNIIDTFTNKFNGKKAPPKDVFIRRIPQYEQTKEGETVVTLTLENPTSMSVQGLSIEFELPKGFVSKGNTAIDLAKTVEANGTAEVRFSYSGKVNLSLGEPKPQIRCRLFNKTKKLNDIQIDAIQNTKAMSENIRLVWMSPDEGKDDINNITVANPDYRLELRVFTTEKLTKDKFKIFIDEEVLEESKLDVVKLDASYINDQQIFSDVIKLTPNKRHIIRVDVETSKGLLPSKELIVTYNPNKPNLHVVSIGTPYHNLKYTAKDAADIANFFNKQPKELFNDIKVNLYNDSTKTNQRNFKTIFSSLVKRYENDGEDKIAHNDYLIAFISTHGQTGESNNKFKLLPSDYDPAYPDDSSIDYEEDILKKLDKIDCRKIVFIDACHSGAARKNVKSIDNVQTVLKLTQAAKGTIVITSCRSDERSYEDENGQNGVFTEALLEAFTNKLCSDSEGQYNTDGDKDNAVTIDEIMAFIKKRVPQLVGNKGYETGQNPIISKGAMPSDIPFIVIKE